MTKPFLKGLNQSKFMPPSGICLAGLLFNNQNGKQMKPKRTKRPSQEMADAINELGQLLASMDLSIKFTGSDVILQLDDCGETFRLPALKAEADAAVIEGELLGELADKYMD